MIFVSHVHGRPVPRTSARSALVAMLLALAGCAGAPQPATLGAAPAAEVAPVRQDPLGRFVAAAAPGQEGTVTLADGRAARVRVLRAYAAASGRECREVLVGDGGAGRAILLCQADGQWVAARPLLGGGAPRP